jgi:hypothetical protein
MSINRRHLVSATARSAPAGIDNSGSDFDTTLQVYTGPWPAPTLTA